MKSSIDTLRRALSAPIAAFAAVLFLWILMYSRGWAQQVFAGPDGYSACAIDANGNLYTWGIDQYSHTVVTGPGGNAQDLIPVQVPFPIGVTTWTSASVGYLFTLAVGNDGNVYAWGLNSSGQLGNGTTTNSNTPVMVNLPGGVKARAVAAGTAFGLALGSDGNVYAWGLNSGGQLGDSTTTNSFLPVMVKMPSGVTATAIFAGPAFSLAIGSDGNTYAWGSNGTGQLGDSTTTNSSIPVRTLMPGGVTATAISAGSSFSLAVGSDGNVYAWGGNGFGQLGNGTKTNSSVPLKVDLPSGVTAKAVAGGRLFASAVGSDGNLYAWGDNLYGELGNDTVDVPASNSLPTVVKLPAGVSAEGVTAIRWSGYALGSNDSVYAWGYNQEGELGIGTKTGAPKYGIATPTADSGLVLALPEVPTLLSPANGAINQPTTTVLTWSKSPDANGYQCEVSLDPTFTTQILLNDSTLTDTTDTANGMATGTVYYWRVRSYNSTISSAFSSVYSFTTSAPSATGPEIIAGPDGYSACVIEPNGKLYTWGIDQYSHTVVTGPSGNAQDLTPVQVGFPSGVTSWTSASVGYLFTLAIGNNGQAYAWGLNSNGQLGNGTTTNSNTPVPVDLPTGVTAKAVSAGEAFGLALGSDGNVYAWGLNSSGQLGDSTTASSTAPVIVKLPKGVTATAIFAAPTFGLALGNDGNVYGWGTNSTGQLGDSTTTNSTVPVVAKFPRGVKATAISAGSSFSLAIGSDGNAYAWGGNGFEQLGNGTSANSSVPVKVDLPSGVTAKAVAGGRLFSLAVGSDGNAYAWGNNLYGQLGDDSVNVPANVGIPSVIRLPSGVTATGVAGIRFSAYASASNDSVYAWGYNQEGELGLGIKTGGPKYGIATPMSISFASAFSPAIPTLLSPANNSVDQPTTVVLNWNKSAGATGYQCQVSLGPTFSTTLVADDSALTDTMDTVSGLTGGTTYYWRVRSYNNVGASAFSVADSFTTTSAALGTPVLALPLNNATFQRADTLVLMWNKVVGASGYEIQLSESLEFSSLVANDSTADTAQTLTELNNSQKYYWRVLAFNTGGAGPFSSLDSFTTIMAVPAMPAPVSPAFSTTGVPRAVTFSWRRSTLASKYVFQVALSSQIYTSGDSAGYFQSAVFDTTLADTAFKLSTPLQPTTIYYWHINAVDTAGNTGFSTAWEFKTGTGVDAVNEPNGIPKAFSLSQNYPNPFNPSTTIRYSLPKAQMVTLRVYNILGQEVATLVDAAQNPGYYEVSFNADRFASGVYFYVLRTQSFSSIHKMLLLK